MDDSADDIFFARRLLLKAQGGVPVLTARSGAEAIKLIDAIRGQPGGGVLPGLVLVDMKMPCMSGVEFLAWAARARLNEYSTLAMLTTSSRIEDVERAYQAGAHAFYQKFPPLDVMADLVADTCFRALGCPPPTGSQLPANVMLLRCATQA